MATTESMFPDRSDFDYDYETLRTTGVILAVIMFVSGILIALIPAPLLPKFQRQRCLLKLYRKQRIYWKKRRSSQEPSQRKHTMAIPLMADIPLPAG
uniref:FXYD domain-containing ion transport regulator n=1 Tax=Sparus aurata TaxID=8175 RepID=A0A671TXN9_SPAAU